MSKSVSHSARITIETLVKAGLPVATAYRIVLAAGELLSERSAFRIAQQVRQGLASYVSEKYYDTAPTQEPGEA